MLDFLKTTQQDADTQGNSISSGDGNMEQAIGSKNQNQEFLTVGDKSNRARNTTYLLGVLFLIGVVCLFIMIKQSTPSAASASKDSSQQVEQAQIESAISKITGIRTQMFSSLEKIVTKFYEFSNVEQVKVNELAKNPFKEDSYIVPVKTDDAQTQLAFLQDELELLSIMSTERGYCCMINDKILYQGDSIKGLRITKITSNVVTLANGTVNMTLKLSDEF